MATIKQKKKLIRTIKNPIRYFRLNFSRYGGEVAMGTITKDQYEYWSDNDGFEEYMGQVDFDAEDANKEIPKRAQFDQPFYEYSNICHMSGPEWADSQTMYIEEMDKDGKPLENEDGGYVQDIQHDFEDLESLGAEVVCDEEHHVGSKSCENEYYIFGQYFNKGGWHTPDIIKTGPDGIEIDKLKIRYTNADGFKVFNDIEYDGEEYYLEEDSTGKSSSFYVAKGDNLNG
jgi:hypothetical protein|tara:strand:- start:70 stop:759 length:690 start_codon:yes stop_codon:yes gene_type:complete